MNPDLYDLVNKRVRLEKRSNAPLGARWGAAGSQTEDVKAQRTGASLPASPSSGDAP
jgi:hypothetical protein